MTTQAMLDERYGRTRRPGRVRAFWIVVGVAAVTATAWLGWSVVTSTNTVGVNDLGFHVHDETSTEVSFQYTAPAGSDVACVLEALDVEFGIVGWKVFEYPADDSHGQRHTETVPTLAEATTGLVNSCWVL